VAPIVDGVITGVLVTDAIYYGTHQGPDDAAYPTMSYLSAMMAIPFAVSVIYGLATTSRCRTYLAGPPYPYFPPDRGR
jgi:hypothetical protein